MWVCVLCRGSFKEAMEVLDEMKNFGVGVASNVKGGDWFSFRCFICFE